MNQRADGFTQTRCQLSPFDEMPTFILCRLNDGIVQATFGGFSVQVFDQVGDVAETSGAQHLRPGAVADLRDAETRHDIGVCVMTLRGLQRRS